MEIAGIAPVPNGLWMRQVARNLIDDVSGFLSGKRFLIHDWDPLYTRGFHSFRIVAGLLGLISGTQRRLTFAGQGGAEASRIAAGGTLL